MESQSYDAYEKYARPPSRRSSVPADAAEIDGRPNTSRGRRRYNSTEILLQESLVEERPKTRGGRHDDPERPKTSRAHRTQGFDPAEYAAVAARYGQPLTGHQVAASAMEDPIERPTTSRGRRRESLDFPITPSPDIPSYDGRPLDSPLTISPQSTPSPRPVPPRAPRSSRPKSAKGRPRPVYQKPPHDQGAVPQASGQSERPPSSCSLNRFTPLPSIRNSPEPETSQPESSALERDVQKLDLNKSNTVAPSSKASRVPSEASRKSSLVKSQQSPQKKTPQSAWPENGSKPKSILKSTKNDSASTPASSQPSKGILKQTKSPASNQTRPIPVSPTKTLKPLTRRVTLPREPTAKEEGLILAVKLPSGQRVLRKFRIGDKLESVLNFAELAAQADFTGYNLICDIPKQVFSNMKITLQDSGLQNRTVLHLLSP